MDTRKSIIECAEGMFLELGYDKTGLNDIAKKLNITKGALYHYFESKDVLFREVLMNLFGKLETWFMKTIVQESDLHKLMKGFFDYSAFFTEYEIEKGATPNLYKTIFDAFSRFPDFKGTIEHSYRSYIALLQGKVEQAQKEGVVREDLDANIFAYQMTVLVEGMLLFSTLAPGLVNRENTDKLLEFIWQGIGTS